MTGDELAYVILRVKTVRMNDRNVSVSFNGNAEASVTTPLANGSKWQYLVFDVSTLGLTGDISTMRIDWGATANDAGMTLLVSDIYMAKSEAIKNAVLNGEYVFPSQVVLPEEETTTDTPTVEEPGVDDIPVIGPIIDDMIGGNITISGCSVTVGSTILAILIPLVALPFIIKKKDD